MIINRLNNINLRELKVRYTKKPKKGVRQFSETLDKSNISYKRDVIRHKLYLDFEFPDKKILLITKYNPNTERSLLSRGYKVMFVDSLNASKFDLILEFIKKEPYVRKIKIIKG